MPYLHFFFALLKPTVTHRPQGLNFKPPTLACVEPPGHYTYLQRAREHRPDDQRRAGPVARPSFIGG